MGLRYRKRVRVSKQTHLNVGTQKASVSLGKPGLTFNVSRRGARATIGVPGTGLSYVTKQVGGSRKRGSFVEELLFALFVVVLLGLVKLIWHVLRAVVAGIFLRGSRSPVVPTSTPNTLLPTDLSQPSDPLQLAHGYGPHAAYLKDPNQVRLDAVVRVAPKSRS